MQQYIGKMKAWIIFVAVIAILMAAMVVMIAKGQTMLALTDVLAIEIVIWIKGLLED